MINGLGTGQRPRFHAQMFSLINILVIRHSQAALYHVVSSYIREDTIVNVETDVEVMIYSFY